MVLYNNLPGAKKIAKMKDTVEKEIIRAELRHLYSLYVYEPESKTRFKMPESGKGVRQNIQKMKKIKAENIRNKTKSKNKSRLSAE